MSLLRVMAVGALVFGLACAAACGGTQKTDDDDGPQTAVEKQRLEAKNSGESDGGKWGGWKYQGDRSDCFYVIGRRCFKSEKTACNAAKCKAPQTCKITGGGPAAVSCDKGE
jgi:hypothetical protein